MKRKQDDVDVLAGIPARSIVEFWRSASSALYLAEEEARRGGPVTPERELNVVRAIVDYIEECVLEEDSGRSRSFLEAAIAHEDAIILSCSEEEVSPQSDYAVYWFHSHAGAPGRRWLLGHRGASLAWDVVLRQFSS